MWTFSTSAPSRSIHATTSAALRVTKAAGARSTSWASTTSLGTARERREPESERVSVVGEGDVVCDERHGGLLKCYRRAA